MRNRLSVFAIIWAVAAAGLLSGCHSQPSTTISKAEEAHFKGGGAIPPDAMAEIAKHRAAFQANEGSKGGAPVASQNLGSPEGGSK